MENERTTLDIERMAAIRLTCGAGVLHLLHGGGGEEDEEEEMGLGFLARRRGLLKREGEGSGWRGGSTLLVAVLLSDACEKQRKEKKRCR